MVSAKTDIGNQHFLLDEVVKTRKKIMCFKCLSAALDFEAEPSPGRFHSFFGVRIQKQISAEVRTNHEKYKIKKKQSKSPIQKPKNISKQNKVRKFLGVIDSLQHAKYKKGNSTFYSKNTTAKECVRSFLILQGLLHQMIGSNQISKFKSKMPKCQNPKFRKFQFPNPEKSESSKFQIRFVFQNWNKRNLEKIKNRKRSVTVRDRRDGIWSLEWKNC